MLAFIFVSHKKLTAIVDRMIKSIDVNMMDFLREIDNSVEQSRAVFNQWDALHNPITPEMWDAIQLKVTKAKTRINKHTLWKSTEASNIL